MLVKAIEFSTKKFEAVSKKNHFLRVLKVLQDEFHVNDTELLIAGILHDTLEDTNTTYDELVKNFSKPIADLVQEVSHPKDYNKEQKLEYYKKLRNIIDMRKADPKSPYHSQYILWIRDFLNSCPDSDEKEIVFKLTKDLEVFVTE